MYDLVMDVQIYPLTIVTCQIGETAVEECNYPEVFIIPRSSANQTLYHVGYYKILSILGRGAKAV